MNTTATSSVTLPVFRDELSGDFAVQDTTGRVIARDPILVLAKYWARYEMRLRGMTIDSFRLYMEYLE